MNSSYVNVGRYAMPRTGVSNARGLTRSIPTNPDGRRPPKVLIVSHWFPPVNIIGAVRVGKFAKFLNEAGYEVRVIAAADPDHEFGTHSLPVEIPPECVTYVGSWRVDTVLDSMTRSIKNLFSRRSPESGEQAAAAAQSASRSVSRFREVLTRHYYALLRIPDARAGWIGAAFGAGVALVSEWRPDVIFASAPPNSSLVAAARIARLCGSPWVAELRDLWVDNPYYEHPTWRLWLDRALEWWTLRSAAGLVSVTPHWTDSLRRRYRQPTTCILNGFVPEDFPPAPAQPNRGDVLSLVYTGNIYTGFRDPTPLFKAIALLGTEREKLAVHFYGPPPEEVESLAQAEGVSDRVFIHERVTYKQSLGLQAAADVLLLLQWNNKKDEGNIPAKFFEYLGAGRPMLMIGYEHGALAEMIRQRSAGLVANDPQQIAAQLRLWIAQRPNGVPALAASARAGMTRDEQFRELEQFLNEEIIDAPYPS